jgi:2-octaprenyl-6-methoxyphenol hydroxylase
MTATSERFDVAIVGGGMVGATLACALAPLGLKIALIEAIEPDSNRQPSFDERTTALSNGGRRILDTLGLWSALAAEATAIQSIHISERGRFGFARVAAAELDLPAMGYVLANRLLGRQLWARIAEAGAAGAQVVSYVPAQVATVSPGASSVALTIRSGDGAARQIEASLVVAAEGANSGLRAAFGIEVDVHDYHQTAIVTTVLPQRFHAHVAYERFTPQGPLALLPLAAGRCAVILTLSPEDAATALAWSEGEFIAELQQRFGFRLGRFLQVGQRSSYPLSLQSAAATSAGRCVIIGNAAQMLHPIAGMGFNLGLRDVACLAEVIGESVLEQRARGMVDCGDRELLRRYDEWRSTDRRGLIGFTDGLVRLFDNPLGLVGRLRSLGLLAFDMAPPAKAALSLLSTGSARRVPKLARGVPLQ